MTTFIILFGLLTAMAGSILLFDPKSIFRFLAKNSGKIEIHILAVVVRLVLGAFLVIQSDVSKYPVVIEFIGWLSVFAALVLAVIGRKNFKRLMAWALTRVAAFGRVGGAIAIVFGSFLVFAFV